MLSVFAHNPIITVRDFRGGMRFTAETFEDASLETTVRADSLEVTGNVNDRDRPEIQRAMREEVLETERYPEIQFRSSTISAIKVAENWYRLPIQGELSLHGVSHPLGLEAQLRILEDVIRLSGEFGLLLSAYRIKRVSALGGLIKLKDEVKLSFDLVGPKEGS
jgi:polyisoprenoid-binding protein YceI